MKGNERSLFALWNEKTQINILRSTHYSNQSNNYQRNKIITSLFEDCLRKFDDFREKA